MIPKFFPKPQDFRNWLSKNHQKETELLVGFYKVGSGVPSITWPQSVDEALCFGWIDGVRRNIDEESYSIRFTPRKATSIWSTVNINKMKVLTEARLMQPAGLAAFALRKENKSNIYTYENAPVALSVAYEKVFKANQKAWDFFQKQPPSYRNAVCNWVMNAKQEATSLRRFQTLISDCALEQKVRHLNY